LILSVVGLVVDREKKAALMGLAATGLIVALFFFVALCR
jgi:hypothetical protein